MVIKLVTELSELQGIRDLQEQNLKKNLSEEDRETQGFVTAEYSVDFLQKMHSHCPSVIAREGDRVVGYALASTKHIRHDHQLLGDLFNVIDSLIYQGQSLKDLNYVIVGQLCVDKAYRGQQLAQKMYNFYKTSLQEKFDCCVTDIDEKNPRSLQAHLKSGFIVLDTFIYGGARWNIVMWDWRK